MDTLTAQENDGDWYLTPGPGASADLGRVLAQCTMSRFGMSPDQVNPAIELFMAWYNSGNPTDGWKKFPPHGLLKGFSMRSLKRAL